MFVKRLGEAPSCDLVHFLQIAPQESEFHCQACFSSSVTSASSVKTSNGKRMFWDVGYLT